MLQSSVHLVMAALLAGLAVATARAWGRGRRPYALIVVAVLVGLTYDNAVLGIGRWLGHGLDLQGLSLPRFWVHALLTPLLIIAGFGAARGFGLRWARSRVAHGTACLAATVLVGWGVVTDVVRLELTAQTEGGVVSYGNAQDAAPVPAIATIVLLVAIGLAVWRSAGWPWLAAGAVVMFVASGLGGVSPLLTNVGELALAGSLYVTERRLSRSDAGRRAAADRTAAAAGRT